MTQERLKEFPDIDPETCLRVQDEAMMEWLRSLRFRGQKPTVTEGWKSRYFARVEERRPETGEQQVIPLPQIALTGQSITMDPDRWTRAQVRYLQSGPMTDAKVMWVDNQKTMVFHCPFPLPIDLSYQVDLWAKTNQDLRYLKTAILARFSLHPMETWLTAEFPNYGDKQLFIEFADGSDTSELETGEEERQLRFTFSVILKGWIFKMPVVRKTIRNAHVAVIDGPVEDEDDFYDWYLDADNFNFNADYTELTSVDESPAHTPPDRVLLTLSFEDQQLSDVGGM